MHNPIYILACGIFCLLMIHCSSIAQPLDDEVLYRQSLTAGRELVMCRGPFLPVKALTDLVPDRQMSGIAGAFTLTLNFRVANTVPIQIWSGTILCRTESERDEYHVLDAMILPNRVILVTAEAGSTIRVREIRLFGISQATALRGIDWSLLAAAIAATPGRLGAKITYDETQKRIKIEIVDSLQDTKQYTQFEQKSEDWEFVRDKQWQAKAPATNSVK